MATQTLKQFVLETLTEPAVDALNFQFGPMRVYPAGYRRDIAGCIRGGRIEVTSDPSRVYAPNQSPANGSYPMSTPRGQVHPFFINPAFTTESGGRAFVRGGLHPRALADLKGTIIHEATHALQDYQMRTLRPRTAEGAAYLAGGIARWQHGYRLPVEVPDPRASIHAFSLDAGRRFLAEANPHRRYQVSASDVSWLSNLAPRGTPELYACNGI